MKHLHIPVLSGLILAGALVPALNAQTVDATSDEATAVIRELAQQPVPSDNSDNSSNSDLRVADGVYSEDDDSWFLFGSFDGWDDHFYDDDRHRDRDDDDCDDDRRHMRDRGHNDRHDDRRDDRRTNWSAQNPAAAGTVVPPNNGLFLNDTSPSAQVD